MTKPISRPWHGLTDYNYIALVSAAPTLFGFAGNPKARNAFLAFGVFGLMAGTLSQPDEMPAE